MVSIHNIVYISYSSIPLPSCQGSSAAWPKATLLRLSRTPLAEKNGTI